MTTESVNISWALGGSLRHPSGRRIAGHSATLVGAGVYILCGARRASFLKFSLDTFKYEQISLGNYANHFHTAALVDDRIIFVGGHPPKGVQGMIAAFDLVSQELQIEPALKEDLLRVYHSAVFVPRRREILVFGGIRAGRVVADLIALDVDTFNVREMFAKGRHPPRMFGHGAVLHDDKMYVFGPNLGPDWREERIDISLSVYILKMLPGAGETWSQVLGPQGSGLPSRRFFATLAHRSNVFLFGGRRLENNGDGLEEEYETTNDLVTFDLNTNTFRVFGGPNGEVRTASEEVNVSVNVHGGWPPPIQLHSPVACNEEMVFFGGQTVSKDSVYLLSFRKFMPRQTSVSS